MFFSCIPQQSLEESVIFLKACSRNAGLYYFCINFYDLPLLKEYSDSVMCRQKSRLTDSFMFFSFFLSPSFFLHVLSHFLLILKTFILPLSFFLSFFLFFIPPSCSYRVTYLQAWMRRCWLGLRLWRPWTSPCPRARRTRSSPTPPTTR